MRVVPVLALAACCCMSTSCVSGLIYQHTVMPLTTDFRSTAVDGARMAAGDTKHLKISYVDVIVDSNGIGEVARQNGLQQVDYADLETLSILGIWTQQWAHVYGR
ncbi:MAG: hypothetical protein JNM25_00040 [Planctomycetes bacterium]|nr:hypothetical protein [Planctomycetota bacterium]